VVKKILQYGKPFPYNSGTQRTDGQMVRTFNSSHTSAQKERRTSPLHI